MPTAPQIDAPLSLGGFFGNNDSSSDGEDHQQTEFDNCYEEQTVDLVGCQLKIRQYAFHSHNANRVWPGTFNLAEYLLERNEETEAYLRQWGDILELGTATGLLAIRMVMASSAHHPAKSKIEANEDYVTAKKFSCNRIVTSDVQDEHGEVEENVLYNYQLNGIPEEIQPKHVPHTWGTGWEKSASARELTTEECCFDTIVASDILLYVSAYGALVQTLQELMALNPNSKFVMSWNRRMKESAEFFQRMKDAGFHCVHEGKCVYTFTRKNEKGVDGS